MKPLTRTAPATHRRGTAANRGTVYLFVIVTVLLTTLITLSALAAIGAGEITERLDRQRAQASVLADAAAQLAIQRIDATLKSGGTLVTGELVASITDAGGSLSATMSVPVAATGAAAFPPTVEISAVGAVGQARTVTAITLICREVAHAALDYAVFAGGTIDPQKGVIAADAPVFAATASNGLYKSPASSGTPPPLPSFATILAPYLRVGATATATSDRDRKFSKILISPTSPPPGFVANGQGVYILDAGGGDAELQDCRVYGTYIVRNCKEFKLRGSVYMGPAIPTWPALIVEGPLKVDLDDKELIEDSVKVNMNPTGAPYRGQTNSTTTDSFPTSIDGIIITNADIAITASAVLYAPLITTGNIVVSDGKTLRVRPPYTGVPAPGLTTWPPYAPLLGGLRAVVN